MKLVSIFIWLLILSEMSPVVAETICRSQDGYTTWLAAELLEDADFTESRLREIFAAYADWPRPGEWLVVATADPGLYQQMVHPKVYFVPASEISDVSPIWSDAPVAYFFRIEGNSFVQFRDVKGKVSWFTLRGENLFHRTIGQTPVTFGGCKFSYWEKEIGCKDLTRWLVLVAEDPSVNDLEQIAQFYDRIFPYDRTGRLYFSVYSREKDAVELETVRYPGLDLMDRYHKQEIAVKNEPESEEWPPPPPKKVERGYICQFIRPFDVQAGPGIRQLEISRDSSTLLRKKGFSW